MANKLNIQSGVYYDPKCNHQKNIGILNSRTDYIEVNASTELQRMQIKPLLIDSLNTYQTCELLPSEVLQQRNEAIQLLKRVIYSTDDINDIYREIESLIQKITQ